MKRKILYISGTRADYGFMRSVLFSIKNHPDLTLNLAATGMHLMPEFGLTIKEIESDGFSPDIIDARFDSTPASVIHFFSSFFQRIDSYLNSTQPDIIVVAGDRAEMLAAATAASYMSIPVAHISGGDISSTIDEHTRHAITKLSQIHFPYTELSASRIRKMGEDSWRIHVVGAPGLDHIAEGQVTPRDEFAQKYHLDPSAPFALLILHPVTFEEDAAEQQIDTTLKAIVTLKIPTIVICPNADKGGKDMIETIKRYERFPFIQSYTSLPRQDYLSLMKYAAVMLGNSSSGIVEAASFHLPVINIGTRQQGRERAGNVIDCPFEEKEIVRAIEFVLKDQAFKKMVSEVQNPYGNGGAGKKIADVLASVEINKKLMQKYLNY